MFPKEPVKDRKVNVFKHLQQKLDTYSLSGRELDETIDTALTFVHSK